MSDGTWVSEVFNTWVGSPGSGLGFGFWFNDTIPLRWRPGLIGPFKSFSG